MMNKFASAIVSSLILFTICGSSLVSGGETRESLSEHAIRMEFVNAMEAATPSGSRRRVARGLRRLNQENQEDIPEALTTRLLQVARPVQDESPFPSSSSYQHRLLNDENYYENAVNLTEYAFKYIGCQNIHSFSDDLAQDGDSDGVLQMNRFVIFRLCPRDACSNYNEYGCNAGFGDYLITMEEYLEAMADYFIAEYEEYCQTCYQCMKKAENANYNNGDDAVADDDANNDDAYNYAGDDGGYNRRLNYNYYQYGDDQYGNNNAADDDNGGNGDDDGNDDDNQNNNGQYECEYYDVCQRYKSACRDYNTRATKYQDYFQCNKFNLGNSVGYMGPHCRSDGKTIGIAIYEDQNCNEYQSDLSDMSENLGIDFSDKYLKVFYSDHCVSCLASEGYGLYEDDNGNGDEDGVSDLCDILYQESAKCNKHMGDDGGYNSYTQQETEDSVCNFISGLVLNQYDEFGEIFMDNDSAAWMAYIPSIRAMSPSQRVGLIGSILLCITLLIYSCTLHRRIRAKNRFVWAPHGGGQGMGRMQSGIISGRSRSGHKFDMGSGLLA